ncbi:argininosuccinate lyase [Aliikangiella sp. G2MR2-5]|uniref:argininosuccinate lyase n=1 Tax=Aliikangiella sp. G2MR2-5 TaxID=2788943 RepID=UPI0018AB2341|nr:argininosuccinate lyase [Aliikangiella sp. G2MR2-5]
MSSPIWQKQKQAKIDQSIMNYMAGEDCLLDKHLIQYDIQASIAHVQGLASINIVTEQEAKNLVKNLNELCTALKNKQFQLDSRFEDGHSAIEFYLTEKLGDLGKKVHTGRSRNDQVLVATRLYMKDAIKQALELANETIETLLVQAKETQTIPMPGYTHMQRAVPSSCGMWFTAFAESMLDNKIPLKSSLELIDANPLGTAAGYGVNLNLNRQLTTEKLGFSRIQVNPIYAQNSRGKLELNLLSALSNCLLDIRRYCWDLSLFMTQEFNMVSLPDEMTTGSSIMPNKRNPDLVELMRAAYSIVQAAKVELESVLSLPSGYQRDLQLTKSPLIRGVNKSLETMKLFPQLVRATRFNESKLREAIDAPMYATDLATQMAAEGVPFREAYKQTANHYEQLERASPEESLAKRISLGGSANLGLNIIEERFRSIE